MNFIDVFPEWKNIFNNFKKSKRIIENFQTEFIIDDNLKETNIGIYEGKKFTDLPINYINENGIYPEIESATSIRKRMLKWIEKISIQKNKKTIIAISHKDPIIILILHFMGKNINYIGSKYL